MLKYSLCLQLALKWLRHNERLRETRQHGCFILGFVGVTTAIFCKIDKLFKTKCLKIVIQFIANVQNICNKIYENMQSSKFNVPYNYKSKIVAMWIY